MKNHQNGPRNAGSYSHSTFRTLVELDLNEQAPSLLQDGASELFTFRQMEALDKKNTSLPGTTPASRKAAALEKFFESEVKCRRTDETFKVLDSVYSDLSNICLGEAVGLARNILGELDLLALGKIFDSVGFGSGMTFGSKVMAEATLYQKVTRVQTITPNAVPYFDLLLRRRPVLRDRFNTSYRVVPGNRVTSVPKTALIDRTIAIEPSLNIFLQKGVDVYMRGRLARYGVDLQDQSRGWPLARKGSIDGSYATIDLSSASDTVSPAVVKAFCGPDWYTLLDDLRSSEYTLDKGKTWDTYSKFSSMGNCFTFPLESLIFYAIARSAADLCGGGEVVVYGDDIIVPRNAALLTMEILDRCGFIPNRDKSFCTGQFRETCGRDYHNGVDVRPIYLASNPKTEVEVYNLFNRFLNNRQGIVYGRALEYLFSLVPNPRIQPRMYGAGEDWNNWKPFESMVYDYGFQVPECFARQRLTPVWHADYQSMVYRIKGWGKRVPLVKGQRDDTFLTMSLYTGDHQARETHRSLFTLRQRSISRWYSNGLWPMFLLG